MLSLRKEIEELSGQLPFTVRAWEKLPETQRNDSSVSMAVPSESWDGHEALWELMSGSHSPQRKLQNRTEQTNMENVKMTVENGELVLRIDLKYRGAKSSTGKTVRVASTEGNIEIPGYPEIRAGLNAFTK